jgi:hypothetical protein
LGGRRCIRWDKSPQEARVSIVFLFGNGLSVGFDPRFRTAALTERVLTRLGPAYGAALADLASLANPDDVDRPLGTSRGNFEALAGPVDRIAEAMTAIETLLASTDAKVLSGLRRATEELRLHYLRIVGSVLAEVDECCVVDAADEGRVARWKVMNDFADRLVALSKVKHTTLFTTNYDSLLMSALLNGDRTIYDGFAGGALNVPLDRYAGTPALYHLHGSVAWMRQAGEVTKPSLAYVRGLGAVQHWADGVATDGWPTVILGDLKSRQAARFPFNLFYGEFQSALASAQLAVVGGYSFGDRPVNAELATFLASSASNRLIVWELTPNHDLIFDRLQVQLAETAQAIKPEQVEVNSVTLPSPDAVEALTSRVSAPRRPPVRR